MRRHARALICLALGLTACAALSCAQARMAHGGDRPDVFPYESGAGVDRVFGLMDRTGRIVLPARYAGLIRADWGPRTEPARMFLGRTLHFAAPDGSGPSEPHVEHFVLNEKGEVTAGPVRGGVEVMGQGLFLVYEASGARFMMDASGKCLADLSGPGTVHSAQGGFLAISRPQGARQTAVLYDMNGDVRRTFAYDTIREGAYSKEGHLLTLCVWNGAGGAVIDLRGNALMPLARPDSCVFIYDGLYFLRDAEDKIGVVRPGGELVVPFLYDGLHDILPNALLLERGDAYDLYDGSGALQAEGLAHDPRLLTISGDPRVVVTLCDGPDAKSALIGRAFFMGGRDIPLPTDTASLSWIAPDLLFVKQNRSTGVSLLPLDGGAAFTIEGATSCRAVSGGALIVGGPSAAQGGQRRLRLYDGRGNALSGEYARMYPSDAPGTGVPLIVSLEGKQPNTHLYGLMDLTGRITLAPQFSLLFCVADGVYRAQRGGRIGYITSDGAWIYSESAYGRALLD